MGWLLNRGSAPLVKVFTQASQDMGVVHLCTIFQAISDSCDNYLRIQDDTLVRDLASADVATKKNLEDLLTSLVILDNRISEPVNQGWMAARLSEEKQILEKPTPIPNWEWNDAEGENAHVSVPMYFCRCT